MTPQTPTPTTTRTSTAATDAREALLHLRPQLKLAAAHPMCPGAMRQALPLLDTLLTSQAHQLDELRADLEALRAALGDHAATA